MMKAAISLILFTWQHKVEPFYDGWFLHPRFWKQRNIYNLKWNQIETFKSDQMQQVDIVGSTAILQVP